MKRFILLLAATLTLAACHRDPHFITDRSYRDEVHEDFLSRKAEFQGLSLEFDNLSRAEREAMEFLYAYMPLSDLADYEPQFFLQQVRYAFKAREEMPWGKDIPEDVFRHFVLVYRVNNENLDTARMVFYRELKERVQGMSIEEAALEVNHWCHEHVAYRASDSRTSAPLATMRTSLGRCGEESTFAVTAMRAVGIPARQCYTPRWAHCDDNHAWVEVFVDGEWKFLGACEPDPRLNMGWFSVPSTRCMMVHSKAFGKYKGDEEVVKRTNLYSELNLLSHYAPTRRVTVTVQDEEGKPLEGAQVKFKLYNYAEYYTLSTQIADKEGKASLTTGLGDLLIWSLTPDPSPKGEGSGYRFAFAKIDVRKDSTLTLILMKDADKDILLPSPLGEGPGVRLFDMVPPVAGEPKVVATEEEAAANAKRLAYEDSVRNAYTASFPTRGKINWHYDDCAWDFIRKSEGNYKEIMKFLNMHFPFEDEGPDCWPYEPTHLYNYLGTFSDKDLRDITCDVLAAHWSECVSGEVCVKGLMPARISNEMVRPYREELSCFKGKSAEEIRRWVMDSITIDDSSNYYNCPISPVGVYRLRRADSHSRDIFFVAACRAAGVPAYLDNATNTIYVYVGTWRAMSASDNGQPAADAARRVPTVLTLTYSGKEPAKPVYWPHFTLARLENGDLRTFDFEDDPRMASFPATLELEPGTYCLSTGNRAADGSVRSRMEFFEVKAGEKASKEIILLPLDSPLLTPHSSLDPMLELFDGIELWDYAGEPGMLYINLGNYSEPSKHLIVELRQQQREMRQWGGMTFMVGPATLNMHEWQLANTDIAYRKGELERLIVEATGISNVQYPLVALVDKEGRILYHSTGYKIGVVEQVLKAIRR